jgi:hypothetical protein
MLQRFGAVLCSLSFTIVSASPVFARNSDTAKDTTKEDAAKTNSGNYHDQHREHQRQARYRRGSIRHSHGGQHQGYRASERPRQQGRHRAG